MMLNFKERRAQFLNSTKVTFQSYADHLHNMLFNFPVVFQNKERKTLGLAMYASDGTYQFVTSEKLREWAKESYRVTEKSCGSTGKINLWHRQMAKLMRAKKNLQSYPELASKIPVFSSDGRRGISQTPKSNLPAHAA